MSTGIEKCYKISRIVRIRQMLRQWRRKAASSSSVVPPRITQGGGQVPSDVPSGHVAICVGVNRKRYVVRATFLNHSIFQNILTQAEEEYGFENPGPLTIPCEESLFEEILQFVSQADSASRCVNLDDFQRCRHVNQRSTNLDMFVEYRPLLNGYADKTIC